MIRRIPVLVFFCILLLTQQAFAVSSFKVIGYVPNWGNWPGIANSLQWDKLTHVHIAFYNPASTSSSAINGNAGLTSFVNTAHTKGVLALGSLGGASANATVWGTWTGSAANRTAFVNSIMTFVNTYNLDGIDVDMEGSTVNGNYQAFVVELGTALHGAGKIMSAAVAPWFGGNITATALAQYDYVGLMSYDATGSWSPCSPGEHAPFSVTLSDIAYWRAKGLTNDKMVLGLPFYGYFFGTATNSATYNSIVSSVSGAEWQDMVTYFTGTAVYYNGIPTIKLKTRYAMNNNYGGVMIWELSQDATGPKSLLTAVDDVVQGFPTATSPTVTITSPATASTSNEAQTLNIDADVVASVPVLKVEFYSGTVKIGEDMTAPYSINWTPDKGTLNLTANVVDSLGGMDTSASVSVTFSGVASTPYVTGGHPIPGTIEAEQFNFGGQGVAYNDVTATNSGSDFRPTQVDLEVTPDGGLGYTIGWTAAGEWQLYTVNVATGGIYDVILRVATPQASKTVSLEMDGVNISGTLTSPTTSGWGCYQNLTLTGVNLSAGQKVLKLNHITGNVNVNSIQFTLVTPVLGKTYEHLDAYVYPNPAAAPFIHASGIEGEEVQIEVSDASGRVLMSYTTTAGSEEVGIPTNELQKGLYFVRLISGNRAATMTWVK